MKGWISNWLSQHLHNDLSVCPKNFLGTLCFSAHVFEGSDKIVVFCVNFPRFSRTSMQFLVNSRTWEDFEQFPNFSRNPGGMGTMYLWRYCTFHALLTLKIASSPWKNGHRSNLKVSLDSAYMVSYLLVIHVQAIEHIFNEILHISCFIDLENCKFTLKERLKVKFDGIIGIGIYDFLFVGNTCLRHRTHIHGDIVHFMLYWPWKLQVHLERMVTYQIWWYHWIRHIWFPICWQYIPMS